MTVLRRLRVGDSTIEYRVVRSNRRKTSELFVDSKTVLIRTPFKKSAKEIEGIIKAKANWIGKKQEEYKHSALQIANPIFEQGSLVPYLGKGYPLCIIADGKFKEEKLRFINGEFLVTLKRSTKNHRRTIHKLYRAWLQQKAESLLEAKVQKYSRELNVIPKRIIVKDMKNTWGSATKSGALNFNLNLLKAPEDVVDYIVLHEVCHLKIRDHSHNFWGLLSKVMPNFRNKINWLHSHAQGLVE